MEEIHLSTLDKKRNQDNTSLLLNDNLHILQLINQLNDLIVSFKNDVDDNNLKIYQLCNHIWCKDTNTMDDLCNTICSECKLYRDHPKWAKNT